MSSAWWRAACSPRARRAPCNPIPACWRLILAIETSAAMSGPEGSIVQFDRVVAGYSPSLTILNETTFDVRRAEITLLIGPNGAGKSTVLKTLFGLLVPRSGEIRFEGA